MAGKRRLLIGAARWALGMAILVFLLLRFDFEAVALTLRHVDLRIAVPALAGLVAVHLLGATAWRELTILLAGVRLPWRTTVTQYYAAQAVGSITPANLGADAYRLAAARHPGAGWTTLLLPIVVQRVTSYVALSLVSLVGLALLPSSFATRLLVLSGVVLTLVTAAVLLAVRRPHLFAGPLRLLPRRLRPVAPDTALPRRAWTAALASGIGLAFLFHATSIALVYALVVALGGSGSPWPVLAAIAVARLSILIPLSPSGLGFQEAALSVLFLQIGLPADMALATALLNRAALVATMALGAGFIASGQTAHSAATRGLTTPTA